VKPQVHVYCGPTISAAEAEAIVPGAVTHPPVCHGDLLRLDPGPGMTVIIIDGVWHQVPSVRHREILWLLAHGAAVVGAASMGALRAAELYPWGMTGTGDIYRAYRDGILAGDDEVAVAMAPGHWRALSVAMADITDALDQAAVAGALSETEATELGRRARAVYYADRTWQAVTAAAAPDLLTAMSRFSRWRAGPGSGLVPAKLRDARQVLQLAAAGTLPRPGPVFWSGTRWGSARLQDWLAASRGTKVAGVHVTFRDILAHQQIYDPAWPLRWRRHVLSWIAGSCGPARPGGALDAARVGGLDVTCLSPAQLSYWLTPAEICSLDDREQLARILTRAVPQDPVALVWPVTARQAGALISPSAGSPRTVAAAWRLNGRVSWTAPDRTTDRLRANLIREHLARTWAVAPDDAAGLTAAARDRGFGSIAAAVDAARPFFLLMQAGPPRQAAG